MPLSLSFSVLAFLLPFSIPTFLLPSFLPSDLPSLFPSPSFPFCVLLRPGLHSPFPSPSPSFPFFLPSMSSTGGFCCDLEPDWSAAPDWSHDLIGWLHLNDPWLFLRLWVVVGGRVFSPL